jgi:hypothetical protein
MDASASVDAATPCGHQTVVWRHKETGIVLAERVGTKPPGPWLNLVLEKYTCEESGRMWLWCPANENWFWQDEAEEQGWERKVLLQQSVLNVVSLEPAPHCETEYYQMASDSDL